MIPPGLQWVDDELHNWGRWGRQRGGPDDVPEPSIWAAWLHFKGRVAGWGLTEAEKEAEKRGEVIEATREEPPLPPINDHWAESADRKLMYMRDVDPRNYAALRKRYYRRVTVDEMELHTAMRQFSYLS